MKRFQYVLGVIALVVAGNAAAPASAVVIGATNDFQDGTVMGWTGGTNISNSPGGLAGDEDLFLLVISNGAATGAGSKLAAHCPDQRWVGNYIGAGVTAIEADMLNVGSTTLQMRLVLFSGSNRWTSTNFVTLEPGSAWQRYSFPIGQADLTRVLGGGSYAGSLGAVDQIMFRHDATTPSSGGESISGAIGIDNVAAVPGPGAAAMMAIGGCAAACRRRRGVR